ncbi:murein biosynthesis integral membrane protein MurJ [Alkalicoccus luteus]|uniref:murein biosynthesis integral membrane protein MurJ n=1 Tax=Alkalicoccus luteus TaxID=1237094 RepID=UPI00403469AF
MKKAVILLMLLTIFSKVIGFLRDVTLAYFYGASGVSDAYLIALTVPVVLFGVVAKGISTGYIPMYSRIEQRLGQQGAIIFTNNLINVLLLFCAVLILSGIVFAEQIVIVFASGFEGATLELAVELTRITLFGILFTVFIRILSAYLNYQKLFAVPNLLGIPMSLTVIASIMLSAAREEPVLLAYGFTAGLALQWVILLIFSKFKKFIWRPVLNVKDQDLKNMLLLAGPVIIGSSVHQINKLVDRTLASQVAVGGVSALNYAHTLTNFVHGVFVISITTVMFPSVSKMASKGSMNQFRYTLHQSMTGVMMLTVPAAAGVLVLSEPIVRLLFGRGAFDSTAVMMTSGAFFFYAFGMVGTGLRVVLSQGFYALQDTRTPMINAAVSMGLNIVLNFMLAPLMGISGLALASSISALFCACLLFIQIRSRTGPLPYKLFIASLSKIISASAVMAAAAFMLYTYVLSGLSLMAALLITVGAGAVLYFSILLMLKEDVLLRGILQLKQKIKR